MSLAINTNVASINAQRYLTNNTRNLNKVLEKLSSGFRINRAGDDAAGLQISETLRTQIRGSKKALDNVQDGISLLNIADAAQSIIQDNLQRIRELTVQAANDTNATAQRNAIAAEINARIADIDRIANSTQFNGVQLLNSATPAAYYIQLGPNNSATNDVVNLVSALGDTTTGASGLNLSAANITSNSAAQAYLGTIDAALTSLNSKRALLGSITNRLDSAVASLSVSIENLSSAESRIRNADVAQETADMTRFQILQQSAANILQQANQAPQIALSLLRGGG
jgi:flagellin